MSSTYDPDILLVPIRRRSTVAILLSVQDEFCSVVASGLQVNPISHDRVLSISRRGKSVSPGFGLRRYHVVKSSPPGARARSLSAQSKDPHDLEGSVDAVGHAVGLKVLVCNVTGASYFEDSRGRDYLSPISRDQPILPRH